MEHEERQDHMGQAFVLCCISVGKVFLLPPDRQVRNDFHRVGGPGRGCAVQFVMESPALRGFRFLARLTLRPIVGNENASTVFNHSTFLVTSVLELPFLHASIIG
jgi:hypothetical protein